jgi:hypothetical protein
MGGPPANAISGALVAVVRLIRAASCSVDPAADELIDALMSESLLEFA